jgi:hypothetical protein
VAYIKRNYHRYRRLVTTPLRIHDAFSICGLGRMVVQGWRHDRPVVLLPHWVQSRFQLHLNGCLLSSRSIPDDKVFNTHGQMEDARTCTRCSNASSKLAYRGLSTLANHTDRISEHSQSPPTLKSIHQSKQSVIIARLGLVHANLPTRIGLQHDPGILFARFDVLAVHFLLFGQDVFDLALDKTW